MSFEAGRRGPLTSICLAEQLVFLTKALQTQCVIYTGKAILMCQ